MTADGAVVDNWPGFAFAYRRAPRRPDPGTSASKVLPRGSPPP
ncbi:hypothetical protein [Actinomadura macra]|nr:hypothetical protein [Actinomadura macra]